MWAVIPVKQLAMSKQRLAGVLTQTQRATLMIAMIEDVLTALAKVQGLTGRLLVTRDARLHALAARYGADVLCEHAPTSQQPATYQPATHQPATHQPATQRTATANAPGTPSSPQERHREENGTPENGLCRALEEAASYLRDRGARGMLIVPGDVPLIDAAEINALLAQHHAQDSRVTIVPDRDSSGTNALLLSPPGCIGLRFGIDSCRRHTQSARDAGLSASVVNLPSLALDIDTAEDLTQLRLRGQGTQAHAVLANFYDGTHANTFDEARARLNGSAQ